MATTCFAVVRGKRVRVTELDDCGRAIPGASYVVSDGFIQVSISSELETGDEIIVKNADGRLCINEKVPDSLKRVMVTTDWCNVDPDLISIITGYAVEMDALNNNVGFRIQEIIADKRWGLEIWTGLGSAQGCDDAGTNYGWLLVPQITGSTIGEIVVASAAANFQTTGYTESNSPWGLGPYGDGILVDPIGSVDHAVVRITNVAPPAAVCGAQVLTSPTSP
jgi:hypothetical protein